MREQGESRQETEAGLPPQRFAEKNIKPQIPELVRLGLQGRPLVLQRSVHRGNHRCGQNMQDFRQHELIRGYEEGQRICKV
jgi:hypothetical protein